MAEKEIKYFELLKDIVIPAGRYFEVPENRDVEDCIEHKCSTRITFNENPNEGIDCTTKLSKETFTMLFAPVKHTAAKATEE